MENGLSLFGEDTLQNAVDRLKAKGAEFSNAYNLHLSNYNAVKNNPQMLAKWQSIKNYADKTKGVIQAINNSVDSGVNWLRDVFGFNSGNLSGLSGVGALPLVPVAYVIGAITALTYVIGEIHKFNQLVKMGATPGEVTGGSGGLFNDASSLIKWGVIGAAIYFAWKKWGK